MGLPRTEGTPRRIEITALSHDFTQRLSFRAGDLLVWLRSPSLFGSAQDYRISDLWYLRDGDHAVVSNRSIDFPPWFELNPTEAANEEASRMMRRLSEGWEPGDVVDGPNIWRVLSGDRIVWIRIGETGSSPESCIRQIFDCSSNALIAGEGRLDSPMQFVEYGALPARELDAKEAASVRAAVAAATALGVPRSMSTDWSIG